MCIRDSLPAGSVMLRILRMCLQHDFKIRGFSNLLFVYHVDVDSPGLTIKAKVMLLLSTLGLSVV